MSSLVEKMDAIKAIKALLENVGAEINDGDAAQLNAHFAVFGQNYVLEKSATGVYDLEQARTWMEKCHKIVSKEYSRRFKAALAIQMMFEE